MAAIEAGQRAVREERARVSPSIVDDSASARAPGIHSPVQADTKSRDQRAEVVEYRVEQHAEALGERLTRLADARRPRLASPDGSQNGTTDGTTECSQSRKSFSRP